MQPRILFSRSTMSAPGSSTLMPAGTTPIMTIVPPLRVMRTAWRTVADIVLREKKILGCMMGSNRFRTDMPRYIELYRRGQLRLDEMISARLPLDRVNEALEAMRQRAAARSVLVFE